MSAKDAPIATRKRLLEAAARLFQNGLKPGTPVYAPVDQIDALRAEGVNAQPIPYCDCEDDKSD